MMRMTKEILRYLLSSFITSFIPLLYACLEFVGASSNGALLKSLLILLALLTPLQGFWNFLIFIAPAYSKVKRRFPEESVLPLLKRVIFGGPHDILFRRASSQDFSLKALTDMNKSSRSNIKSNRVQNEYETEFLDLTRDEANENSFSCISLTLGRTWSPK